MDVSKIPIEMVEYRHSIVYAVPSGFGNDKDGFNKLVYIPAIESYVLGDISEHFCTLQIYKEKFPNDPRVREIENIINNWLTEVGKMLCRTTARDECKIVPTVLELPRIKEDEENDRSVWECRVWPPCQTKHEAWHVAMTLCDIEINKIRQEEAVKEKHPDANPTISEK